MSERIMVSNCCHKGSPFHTEGPTTENARVWIDSFLPRAIRSPIPSYQSEFRANHSTETLLLSLLSDAYSAIDKPQVSLLALFDVSQAFDMVEYEIILKRLQSSYGP